MKETVMDQTQQEPPVKRDYEQPTLQEREHVDEVVWGQPVSTTARSRPPVAVRSCNTASHEGEPRGSDAQVMPKKDYQEPTLQKQERLVDVTEGGRFPQPASR